MKKATILTFVFILISQINMNAQLVAPESIIYNEYTDTYIVSDAGAGKILSIDSAGNYSDFTTGLTSPKGMAFSTISLWVTDETNIVEIEPNSGEILNTYPISGSVFLNDIVFDDFGFLYISDTKKNVIYEFDALSLEHLVLTENITAPNGMYLDDLTGGLIVVSFAPNASIYEVNLGDGSFSELMKTSLGNLDGITYDIKRDRYYISSWESNAIYGFEPSFMDEGVLLAYGINGPADIFYDEKNDVLVVPVMTDAYILLIDFTDTGVDDYNVAANYSIYPNPVIDKAVIEYGSNSYKLTNYIVYDNLGNIVIDNQTELIDGRIELDLSNLRTGVYFFSIANNPKVLKFIKK